VAGIVFGDAVSTATLLGRRAYFPAGAAVVFVGVEVDARSGEQSSASSEWTAFAERCVTVVCAVFATCAAVFAVTSEIDTGPSPVVAAGGGTWVATVGAVIPA